MAAGESQPNLMQSAISDRPTLDWEDVATTVARFGNFSLVKKLPSERDLNLLVQGFAKNEQEAARDRVVFKCHNPSDDSQFIDLQIQALDRASAAGASCQQPLRTQDTNETYVPLELPDGSGVCLVRALSYLPGEMLAEAMARVAPDKEARDGHMAAVGRAVGSVTKSLLGFEHQAATREFQWDILQCETVISERLVDIAHDKLPLVERCLAKYRTDVKPLLPQLRRSIVHNDANDYNLVVMDNGDIGVLDFGDMCHTLTVADAAICLAYLLFHVPPEAPLVESILPFVRSYHMECSLTEAELKVLFDLAVMRVCTSVAISSNQSKLEPHNEYLLISAKPAWALLERLSNEAETCEAAAASLRAACDRLY
eukprot:TRINITY_DN34866_c0_g1_i1.p1 TRINITY_DN34866_c0_g1~~TRINITY_DN34866_c0_g1_i1.p1  ORF type:complete len:370 (+),score=74.49 TRINITY_DN34866_c0_g1_i1:194-1303(+)